MNDTAYGRSIDINGARLHYLEQGEGAPLVLLHGGLMSSVMLKPLLPELADVFRVITPDTRGHGRSTNPDGELSYPQIADDVAALIAELGLDRPVVGGWSDGGQVALELGARHPTAAAALIVGAAYPEFVHSGLRNAHKALLAADDNGVPDLEQLDSHLGEYTPLVKSQHPGGPLQWQALVEQTASMWLDYVGLTQDEVRGIETPVLVLGGDRDELVSLDLTIALFRALPQAELAICPQADHGGPSSRERAGVFTAMIRDFAERAVPCDQADRAPGIRDRN